MNALVQLFSRAYALTLLSFPQRHRAEYRADMLDTFTREVADRHHRLGAWQAVRFAIAASFNAISAGLGERRRHRGRANGGGFRLSMLGTELIQATRSLRKARSFSFVSVVSLGVGMGTVIAILMFLRVILSPPLSINTDDLVEVLVTPQGDLRTQVGDWAIDTWSYPDFTELRENTSGMMLAGWVVGQSVFRPAAGTAQRVASNYVSPTYFKTLGVSLAAGRGFDESERDAQPRVIVSYRFWQNSLGADSSIVGHTISVDGVEHVVSGITPDGFRRHLSAEEMPGIQLYLPLTQHPRLQGSESVRFKREIDWVRVLGRLSPGTSLTQADAAASSLMAGIAARHPSTNALKLATVQPYNAMGARNSGASVVVRSALLGLSGIVLLVVCLNISGMVMVRSARREREIAVRLAMGASRARLIQSLLSESFVLALFGGALATAVIFSVPPIISWWMGQPLPDPRLRPDLTMIGISLGLCFVTSLVFGLMPAIRWSRPNVVSALKDEAGGGGGRRVGRTQRLTAAIQAGIAVPFLVMCALKLDNVRITATADLGFATAGLYALPLDMANAPPLATVRRNLELAPGVSSVTFADGLPLDFDAREVRIAKEDDATLRWTHVTRVDPGYLETMQIPLRAGRTITTEDRAGTPLVTLLSEPLAMQLFPDGTAVGRTLSLRVGDETAQRVTVIGVTGDLVASQMASRRPQMFLPLSQHPQGRLMVIARSTASVESMQANMSHVLPETDRQILQASLVTGAGLIERSRQDLFSHSAVAGACAGIALILTALGVFGVVGFMVATRTREIGVRVALGASRAKVLVMVLRDTARLVLPGVSVGTALAVYMVRSDGFELSFYDLGVAEPLAYAVAVGITIGVALMSALPSARRAAKVEPIIALKSE